MGASYNPQLVGSVQNQETPDLFQNKFEVKSSTAIKGKVKSKSSDRALKRSTTRGFVPEHEETQDYTHGEQKLENVNSSTIRKTSTERATTMSQNVGFLPEEVETGSMKDLVMKGEKVEQKHVRSESCERVETQPKCIGYTPRKLKTEDIDTWGIKEEHAQKKHDSNNKFSVIQQSKNIGFHPREDSSQELGMNKMKHENISPKDAFIIKGTASLNSKKLGFNPPNITSEEFVDNDIKKESAKVSKIRSESSERVMINPNKMGFEPLDLDTQNLNDVDMKSSKAVENLEVRRKEKAQNISIQYGRFDEDHNVHELEPAQEESEVIKKNVERNKSSERATIYSKTMGFFPNSEETSRYDDESYRLDTADESKELLDNRDRVIFVDKQSGIIDHFEDAPILSSKSLSSQTKADIGEVVSPKQRASSQIRVEGFEPILEDAKEFPTGNLALEKSLKGEDKVHRESRSRALKRETKTGVGHLAEEAKLIENVPAFLSENASESLVEDNLDIAKSESPQERFEPQLDTTLRATDVKETIISSESIHATKEFDVENKKNQQQIEKGKRKRIEKKLSDDIEDKQENVSTELDGSPKKKEQATDASMKEKMAKTDQNINKKIQNGAEASSFPVKLKKNRANQKAFR